MDERQDSAYISIPQTGGMNLNDISELPDQPKKQVSPVAILLIAAIVGAILLPGFIARSAGPHCRSPSFAWGHLAPVVPGGLANIMLIIGGLGFALFLGAGKTWRGSQSARVWAGCTIWGVVVAAGLVASAEPAFSFYCVGNDGVEFHPLFGRDSNSVWADVRAVAPHCFERHYRNSTSTWMEISTDITLSDGRMVSVTDTQSGSLTNRYRVVLDRLQDIPYRYDLSNIQGCPAAWQSYFRDYRR